MLNATHCDWFLRAFENVRFDENGNFASTTFQNSIAQTPVRIVIPLSTIFAGDTLKTISVVRCKQRTVLVVLLNFRCTRWFFSCPAWVLLGETQIVLDTNLTAAGHRDRGRSLR